jgi:hypothetical protein
MPSSSEQINEPGVNPLAPLDRLLSWAVSTTVHVALGLAIGYLLARMMRGRHLHWSWSAWGLGLIVLAYPVFKGAGVTLGTATLVASMHGRRWHRKDLEAGADLAELAERRLGPLDALRNLSRGPLPAWLQRYAPARVLTAARASGLAPDGRTRWFQGEELIVGSDEDGLDVSIPLGGQTGGTHTLVVGAAGSGKTVTQTWIALRAIEGGMGAIVVDPKGDRDLREELSRAARVLGRPFIEWTPAGPSVYNPYARGSETEIADKALAGERYTEPHYLRQAQRYLGHAVRAMRGTELEVSLQGIVDHLDPARLDALLRSLPESETQRTNDYLDSLTARQRSDLAGVRDRLAILAESDVGQWLDPQAAQAVNAERFELLEAVRERAVVYFNLEADRRPLLTQMLGAAIVQDLQTTVAALQGRPIPTLVVIDEFSAIAPEHVSRLFARARSAGVSLLLGTQELSDLRLPGREQQLLDQVMGNLSTLISHRQVVPDSAALIARLAGTRGVWRSSHSSDGRSTRTRTREGVLDPNDITSLARGWAAVIVLSDGGRVRITHIFSPKSAG